MLLTLANTPLSSPSSSQNQPSFQPRSVSLRAHPPSVLHLSLHLHLNLILNLHLNLVLNLILNLVLNLILNLDLGLGLNLDLGLVLNLHLRLILDLRLHLGCHLELHLQQELQGRGHQGLRLLVPGFRVGIEPGVVSCFGD